MSIPSTKDAPAVLAHPPLIYGVFLVAGLILDRVIPMRFIPAASGEWTGAVLVMAGIALAVWCARLMIKAGTNIPTHLPTLNLVRTGPYAYSRNPIYIALTLIYLGGALTLRSEAALLLAPCAIMVIHFGVILKEEQYLENKFGDSYRAYQKTVHRWLSFRRS